MLMIDAQPSPTLKTIFPNERISVNNSEQKVIKFDTMFSSK
jgi:hypothetical protein